MRNDAFRKAYEYANTALYLSSVSLTNNPNTGFLNRFIQSVEALSAIFIEYSKDVANIQLRIQTVHKLEKEIYRSTISIDYLADCEFAIMCAHDKATKACHAFGNIEPFLKRKGQYIPDSRKKIKSI